MGFSLLAGGTNRAEALALPDEKDLIGGDFVKGAADGTGAKVAGT
jgi:hypothetical protein